MGSRLRNGPPLKRVRPAPEFRIEKLVPGGEGYARLPDGRSAFVAGALPGDLVRPREISEKKGYLKVLRFELGEPGPERVAPPCPIAVACGGCDWMALSEAAQRHHKLGLVSEALARVGGIALASPPELVSTGAPLAYRRRVRVHFDARGRVGFFGRGSHELVEVRRCLVVVPELDAALSALSDLPVAARAVLARFAGAELRAAPDGQIDLELVAREGVTTNEAELAELRGLLEPFRVRRAGGSPGALRRYPLPGGAFLSVPDGAFTQVNWDVNAELVGRVVAGARTQGAASFLDLYAGVGNFSVPLAHTGLRGVAVEQHRGAVSGLRAALAEQKLDCEVVLGDVEGSLERLRRAKRRFDLVILDPPRAGAKEVVPKLLALAPQRIAYVACDPVTLARDARALLAGGYTLAELVCFDMFPQTHHVETLAWFARPIAPALVT